MLANDNLDPAHVEWSRQQFRILADGGSWAVPRSGMIFVKRGKRLELAVCMPHDPAMPCSKEELREQQRNEFKNIKRYFKAAGIDVVDVSKEEIKP
jgi:hypothetical protein